MDHCAIPIKVSVISPINVFHYYSTRIPIWSVPGFRRCCWPTILRSFNATGGHSFSSCSPRSFWFPSFFCTFVVRVFLPIIRLFNKEKLTWRSHQCWVPVLLDRSSWSIEREEESPDNCTLWREEPDRSRCHSMEYNRLLTMRWSTSMDWSRQRHWW